MSEYYLLWLDFKNIIGKYKPIGYLVYLTMYVLLVMPTVFSMIRSSATNDAQLLTN
jgi:hypothetical protein